MASPAPVLVELSVYNEAQTAKVGGITLEHLRVGALLRCGLTRPCKLDAVLDTGAPVLTVPQWDWKGFEVDITWLSSLNDPTVPGWCRQVSGIGGGSFPCRLGTVRVAVLDMKSWAPFELGEVAALFVHDGGLMKRCLLGLETLSGFEVRLNRTAREASLVRV